VIIPAASIRIIAAPTEGLITAVRHQVGESVQMGQPVLTLSAPALIEARRIYLQAKLKQDLTLDRAKRDRSLLTEGLIAETRWRSSQHEATVAAADVAAARASLQLLGAQPEGEGTELNLNAPMAGIILATLAEPGQRVEPSTPLVKIGNLTQLGLEIPVTPAQANILRVGQTVTLENKQGQGSILAFQPSLDSAQNVNVSIRLTQIAATLRPGQQVQVHLSRAAEAVPTLRVLASSLVWQGDKPYVFIDTGEGFIPTAVTVLYQNSQQADISGLPADSRIAIKGIAALKAKWQEAGE
jgi:RND family efflux transporter MFP subunit